MKLLRSFIIFLVLSTFSHTALAQNWDYEKFPRLDVDFQHLEADIRISEDGFIEGDVVYNVRFKRDQIDSLNFHAARMNIISVSVNDEVRDHSIDDDRLIIPLQEDFSRGDIASVRIQYDTSPVFGVHRNGTGAIWTSQLPKSTRHWLPVVDHPRVAFTTDIIFTHPSGKSMIASGNRTASEVVSVDEESSTFTSSQPIPATALSWATGELEENRVSGAGGVNIYLYTESGEAHEELGGIATNTFSAILNETGTDYPFQDLHIVILDDDHWETKSYGAGVVYAYKSKENIEQQIQRGIIGQWAGVQLREEQWSDADPIKFLQALLANKHFDFDLIEESETPPYDVFSEHQFSLWQHTLAENGAGSLSDQAELLMNELFTGENTILGWQEFAGIIYNETGLPYFDNISTISFEAEETTESRPEYIARVEWEEGAETAEVHFEALQHPVDELVTVRGEEITINDVRNHEITFSGQSDGVVISVSRSIENLKLYLEDGSAITLHEEKPFLFWIHQLRNDESDERRVEAAAALSRFTENPDLQLALNDVLQMESNPEVYAEILRSISRITAGASGTDERFLQYSSSNQHPLIQQASVEALAYFRENDRVISRLRTIIIQTDEPDIRREAIRSMFEVTDGERFSSQVEYLVTQEPVLDEVPLLLKLLAEKGEAENAVDFASTFVSEEFSYVTRKGALEVMLEYDESPSNWQERLPDLLTDRHPRIRYRAAQALDKLSGNQRNQIVADRIDDEYDERVRELLGR
jgi:hypothetical protein